MIRARRYIKRIALIAAIALVAVAVGFFAHTQVHKDDMRLIQGEWLVEGNNMTMVIDATTMHLPQNVDYAYQIDPMWGRLDFSNGSLVGKGTYRFSDKGQTLIITEKIPTLTTNSQGEEVKSTTSTTLMLTRMSYNTSARPVVYAKPAEPVVDEPTESEAGEAGADGSEG